MAQSKNPKYLKQYMGVTEGSFMGRDDGYPETKNVTFDDLESLSSQFGTKKDEKYYQLIPIDIKTLEGEVNEIKELQDKEKKEAKKKSIDDQIAKLQAQRELLED